MNYGIQRGMLSGLADTNTTGVNVQVGSSIQWTVPNARESLGFGTSDLQDFLNASGFFSNAVAGFTGVSFLTSGTLNITVNTANLSNADMLIQLINQLAGEVFSFDATQVRFSITQPDGSAVTTPNMAGSTTGTVIQQQTAQTTSLWDQLFPGLSVGGSYLVPALIIGGVIVAVAAIRK